MPYRPCEGGDWESAPEHPVTPTQPNGNDGASHADQDAEVPERESERKEELGAKKIRQPLHVLKYLVVKRAEGPRWIIQKGTESEKIYQFTWVTFALLWFSCAYTRIAANADVRFAARLWGYSRRTT